MIGDIPSFVGRKRPTSERYENIGPSNMEANPGSFSRSVAIRESYRTPRKVASMYEIGKLLFTCSAIEGNVI